MKKVLLRGFPMISERVGGTWKPTGLGIEALVAEKNIEEAKQVFANSTSMSAAALADPIVIPFEGVGILYFDGLRDEDFPPNTKRFRDSGWVVIDLTPKPE